MSFRQRLMVRNAFLFLMYQLFSLTSILLVYLMIKYERFSQFKGSFYPNADLENMKHLNLIFDHFFNSQILPFLWWIPVTMVVNHYLKRIYVRY